MHWNNHIERYDWLYIKAERSNAEDVAMLARMTPTFTAATFDGLVSTCYRVLCFSRRPGDFVGGVDGE